MMTHPDSAGRPDRHDAAGLLAARQTTVAVWLVVAPPALLVGLRWVLEWLASRGPQLLAWPLTPVTAPQSLSDLLWPLFAALIVLCALAWSLHRLGWRRAARGAGVLWVLLWLVGSGALLRAHLNLRDLQPLPEARAQVLASQFKLPSQRGTGGTRLFLKLPGYEAPHSVLLDDPEAAQVQRGDTLALALARGRFDGLFVTGWRTTRIVGTAASGSLR